MAIRTDFIAKHLRPFKTSGLLSLFSADFKAFLLSLGFTATEIVELSIRWGSTAIQDPNQNPDAFIDAADDVSRSRWSELGIIGDFNTVFFVDQDQLAKISMAGQLAGANVANINIDFGTSPIQVAVTMQHSTNGHTVARAVRVMSVSTDGAANICHLAGFEG